MYCTKCGHDNPDDARFCASCGSALTGGDDTVALTIDPSFADEESPSLDELSADQALLIIKGGPTAGSTVLVDRDMTRAGRHTDSDLFLDDITVSRRHAEIVREGGKFRIQDAGSLNGTYVNRQRVESAQLTSGDELQIGKFKIIFYTSPGGAR